MIRAQYHHTQVITKPACGLFKLAYSVIPLEPQRQRAALLLLLLLLPTMLLLDLAAVAVAIQSGTGNILGGGDC